MYVEKVIEQGKNIDKPKINIFSEFNWVRNYIIFMNGLIGVILLLWNHFHSGGHPLRLLGLFFIVSSFLYVFSVIELSVENRDGTYRDKITEWKNFMVEPYIESLPKNRMEVISVKIKPELSHKLEGYYNWRDNVTDSVEVHQMPLTVTFKDRDQILTLTNCFGISMNLTDEETPYIEYQTLNVGLGHGIELGNYNLKLFLPANYTFA